VNDILAEDCGKMGSRILLPKKIIDEFNSQALEEYPHECCGFLIGDSVENGVEAEEYVTAQNSRIDNRESRFVIDPRDYLKVEYKADSQNRALIGIVHSHPDAPDTPSEYDRIHALVGFSYIIISTAKDKITGYSSWRLADNRKSFSKEEIEVIE
jgi:proteasome lid subunit RPN8/RPN11